MHKILLEKMIFQANHGLFEEETIIGGRFEVDLEIETDFSESMISDEISGTIDYSKVYQFIKAEFKQPSALLEHLGKRIIDRIKKEFFPVQSVLLKISKLNPPISGEIERVSIVIRE